MSVTKHMDTAGEGERPMADLNRILEETGADPTDVELVGELQSILDGTYEPREPARTPTPDSAWWLRVPLVVLSFFVWTPLWAFSQSAWMAVGLPVWLTAAAWVLYFQGRGWPHRRLLDP